MIALFSILTTRLSTCHICFTSTDSCHYCVQTYGDIQWTRQGLKMKTQRSLVVLVCVLVMLGKRFRLGFFWRSWDFKPTRAIAMKLYSCLFLYN